MKRLPVVMLVGALAVTSSLIGCRDESDPEYWLDYMYKRAWREKSLKTLNEIFNKAMHKNKNDLESPEVKALRDLMVPELIKAFKEFSRDKFNRTEIIKLLAQMKDERALDVYLQGLEMEDTSDSLMFQVSANAARRMDAEAAVPKLLAAYKLIKSSRDRRPGAPFTNSENEIAQAVISSSTYIIANKPSSSHKAEVVKMLCELAETTDELQELRLNMKALKGIGHIGDSAGIPTLIKGIAMKGKRQPIGLGEIAFAGLQQIKKRDAVVDAVIQFAWRKDASFNEFYKEELKSDLIMANPTWYLQQAVVFLGQLNYPSPKVIEFLTGELNHTEPDALDEGTAKLEGLPVNFDAAGWATMRRNWAAVALAELAYKPLLNVIKERMVFKKNVLQVQAEEAVGYVRSMGLLLYPNETCDLLKTVAQAGDDSLRDKVFFNSSQMCGAEILPIMKKSLKKINCEKIIAERFPDGAAEDEIKAAENECDIMKKRIQGYIDTVDYGIKCGSDMNCYIKTVDAKADPQKQRAIYALYMMARDDSGKRAKVLEVLMKNLNNPSKAAMEASIFALDRLTPKGDPKLVQRIQEVYGEIKSSYKGRARMLESFIGRVRNRAGS